MTEDYQIVDGSGEFVELSYPNQPNNSKKVGHYDPSIGQFDNHIYSLPFVEVNDIAISFHQNTLVKLSPAEDVVTFSYHLNEGNLDVKYTGSGQRYTMESTSHTMIHDLGQCVGKIGSDAPVNILGIFMSAEYFAKLLQGKDKWSDGIADDIQKKRSFVHTAKPDLTPGMKHAIGSIQGMLRSGRPDPLQMQSAIFGLLAQHLEGLKPQEIVTPQDGQIKKDDIEKLVMLRQYIDTHFLEHNSLSDFAQLSTLNEFKLKKGFRLLFNMSIFQYVNSLRMDYARVMLCEEQKNTKEMAAILGYRYVHHFTAAYKKYHGIGSVKRSPRPA